MSQVTSFYDLDEQVQDDLLAWYNVAGDIDEDSKQLLADLRTQGRFHAWDCPGCGDRCYYGSPVVWDDFQGVLQVDYTSYPGDKSKYTREYLAKSCDYCRCHDVGPAV